MQNSKKINKQYRKSNKNKKSVKLNIINQWLKIQNGIKSSERSKITYKKIEGIIINYHANLLNPS